MQHELGKSRNGFASEDIAQTAFTVYSMCHGVHIPWEQADQSAWDRLATKAIRLIDENIEHGGEMSAAEFARALYGWFSGQGRESLDPMDIKKQIIFEAVGRHLVNCLDAEQGSVILSEMESQWPAWVARKMKLQGVSIHDSNSQASAAGAQHQAVPTA